MFCPRCGSNQGEGKRFCTVCGTNLAAVSQALTGQIPPPNYYAPPTPHPIEIERQRDMAKGVRLSIIGGGIVALKFFSFIFSGHFEVARLSVSGRSLGSSCWLSESRRLSALALRAPRIRPRRAQPKRIQPIRQIHIPSSPRRRWSNRRRREPANLNQSGALQ